MKLFVGGLLVLASLTSLSGCASMRPVGPCYGEGCPALSASLNPSPKSAALSKSPDANRLGAKTLAGNQRRADSQPKQGN